MATKLDREDIHMVMQEAMQAGEQRAASSSLSTAALERSGGDIDVGGQLLAVSVKLVEFWSEDHELWFDRPDNQF